MHEKMSCFVFRKRPLINHIHLQHERNAYVIRLVGTTQQLGTSTKFSCQNVQSIIGQPPRIWSMQIVHISSHVYGKEFPQKTKECPNVRFECQCKHKAISTTTTTYFTLTRNKYHGGSCTTCIGMTTINWSQHPHMSSQLKEKITTFHFGICLPILIISKLHESCVYGLKFALNKLGGVNAGKKSPINQNNGCLGSQGLSGSLYTYQISHMLFFIIFFLRKKKKVVI